MLKKCLFLILFVATSATMFAQNYSLNGYIRDAETGEELIRASVFVDETKSGGVTNVYGYYSISLPKGTYHLTYSFVGKNSIKKEITLSDNIRQDIELDNNSVQLKAFEVSAEKEDQNVRSAQISTVKMEVNTIKKLPAFMGEVDVLKTIQMLPGVQSGGEGNTGFFVRGGSQDQNLILLDEAPVYNASHLFNFFSVFGFLRGFSG